MTKINPPLLYKIFIVLILLSLFIPVQQHVVYPYNLIGVIPFVFGIYMAINAKSLFKSTNTPMNPQAKPTNLHQTRFFKYSRNPMYLGISIGLLGLAILSGILFNLIYSLIYLLICNFAFVKKEEEYLTAEFGAEFEKYKKKTRRWI